MKSVLYRWWVIACVAVLVLPLPVLCQVTVILSRHAEKATAPPEDPPLTSAGEQRAKLLASVLADAGVDQIFVTQYLRTRQTAAPLATRIHLEPTKILASDADKLVKAIRSRQTGVVVVIGHSDSVPEIITALGGPPVTIGDTEFDNLFVLNTGAPKSSLVRLHYGAPPGTAPATAGMMESGMQIKFSKSGGFAGTATNVEGTVTIHENGGEVTSVDGYRRALTTDELQLLRTAADPSRLQTAAGGRVVPDGFQYDVSVTASDAKTLTSTFQGEQGAGQRNSLQGWVVQECQEIWKYRAGKR